jgi:hypothetical protein
MRLGVKGDIAISHTSSDGHCNWELTSESNEHDMFEIGHPKYLYINNIYNNIYIYINL